MLLQIRVYIEYYMRLPDSIDNIFWGNPPLWPLSVTQVKIHIGFRGLPNHTRKLDFPLKSLPDTTSTAHIQRKLYLVCIKKTSWMVRKSCLGSTLDTTYLFVVLTGYGYLSVNMAGFLMSGCKSVRTRLYGCNPGWMPDIWLKIRPDIGTNIQPDAI